MHLLIKPSMNSVKDVHVQNGKLRGLVTLVVKKGTLQIGIRAKVSTLSLDGPVEQSLD
jgi:hypothetical protein